MRCSSSPPPRPSGGWRIDLAGNTSTGSQRFAIDTAAPTSSASATPSPNGGFSTVSITSNDNVAGGGAGVDGIQYRLNGGAWQAYNGPFTVVGNGSYTLEYFATDLAENDEAPKTLTFEVTTPERPLASCRVSISPSRIRAGERTRIVATARAGRVDVAGAAVRFSGPGFNRTVQSNSNGVASVTVRPSRKGTLRVNVAANASSRACSASKPIAAPARKRSGVAGTGASGGAGLTGRPN